MSYDYGPLVPYEIIWRSGHVETIHAHQVLLPSENGVLAEALGLKAPPAPTHRSIKIHGMIDGYWRLLLLADADDILSIRALPIEAVAE